MQVSVLGPFANSSEMLLGNYYGTPAGPVTTPFEAIQVTLAHQPQMAQPDLPLFYCIISNSMHVRLHRISALMYFLSKNALVCLT